MFRAACLLLFCCLTSTTLAGPLKVTTGMLKADFVQTPLDFEIRGVPATSAIRLTAVPGGKETPCQVERLSTGARIHWLAGELKSGTEAVWEVDLLPQGGQEVKALVEVKPVDDKALQVLVAGKELTRLVHDPAIQKPFFFPLMGPTGKMITRQFPMKAKLEGEDQDHPHQRSLWFTHGSVGGVDFWSEGPKAGTIRQTKVESIASGPVFGEIITQNEWLTPDGTKLLEDRRVFRAYPLPRGESLLDLSITLTPAAEAVPFGDTKEGTFGIRLAESMKESRGGRIVNSRGQLGMDAAWGKPAEWVDYHGLVEGARVGVAIFDHPGSFRHPTHWHVRNYGLLAANPFGYRDFYRSQEKDGGFLLEKGKSMEFHYRVYLHHGDTAEARVAQVYAGFTSPPPLHPQGQSPQARSK